MYTYHRNIFSSNHNKNYQRKPRTIHISKLQYNFREKINVWYAYYTNTYVELIRTIFIELSANGLR